LIPLLMQPMVLAQEFHTYSIRGEIFDDTVLEEVDITFSNISDLSYIVDGSIEDLQVSSRDGQVTYSIERGPPSYVVTSDLSGKGHLGLAFRTDAPLLEEGDEMEAIFKLRFPLNVSYFSLRLILPENTLPTSTRDTYSIFPTPTSTPIEEGKYSIIWEREDIEEGEEMIFTVSFRHQKGSRIPYLLVAIMVLILAAGIIVYHRKKEELFMRGLDRDERRVVRLIKEGREDQKGIQMKLGISKVKMTRLVQKLEDKGILRKEKTGRRNKLFLR